MCPGEQRGESQVRRKEEHELPTREGRKKPHSHRAFGFPKPRVTSGSPYNTQMCTEGLLN